MIIHLKRICLTVENAGDFLVIKFIIVAEIEYQPLLLRQSQYGFLKLDGQLIFLIHIVGSLQTGNQALLNVFGRNGFPPFTAIQQAETFIRCNPVNPCAQ